MRSLYVALLLCGGCTESGSRPPEPDASSTSGDTSASTTAPEPSETAENSTGGNDNVATSQPGTTTTTEATGGLPTSGTAQSEDSTGTAVTDGDSTGEPTQGDPSYPHSSGGCPANTFDLSSYDASLNYCAPLCDLGAKDYESACPQPEDGTAPGRCLVLGPQIGEACDAKGAPCATPRQFCIAALAGGFFCGEGIACSLDCRNGEACPGGMSCDGFQCVYD